ncbi:hypothetical protein FI667_g15939, partial [Globisporangium splendens]
MHTEGDLPEQFTFQSAMKRPSDQVNQGEERPLSKRQQTAPELFDVSSILKKKGDLEFYKERFFSWRRINDRDDPNQHIAAQRDSWRTFVRLENENKMGRLLRRGNARAERRTPAFVSGVFVSGACVSTSLVSGALVSSSLVSGAVVASAGVTVASDRAVTACRIRNRSHSCIGEQVRVFFRQVQFVFASSTVLHWSVERIVGTLFNRQHQTIVTVQSIAHHSFVFTTHRQCRHGANLNDREDATDDDAEPEDADEPIAWLVLSTHTMHWSHRDLELDERSASILRLLECGEWARD